MNPLKICPECGGCGWVREFKFVEGTYRLRDVECTTCNRTGFVLSTNADRIRAMSDEELAEFISRIEIGDFGPQVYGKTFCDMCKGQYECDDCRLWWLQQPAEEDT